MRTGRSVHRRHPQHPHWHRRSHGIDRAPVFNPNNSRIHRIGRMPRQFGAGPRHWNHQHSIKRQCLPCGIQSASVFDDKCRRRRIRANARGPNRKLDSPQWGHRHRRDFALRNNIGQFGQNRSHIEYQRSCHQQHLLLVQNGKASADRVDIWCRIYPRRYVRRIMRANMCEKFHGKCDLSRGAV